ncbi:MAG: hypothetical protein O3B95_09145 [Chloroflexi bacterium]|nr:hypothetical protein [Chloroflexota bacterium]
MHKLLIARTVGELVSPIAVVTFLALDLAGVAEGIQKDANDPRKGTQSINCEWWALGAFVVFVVLIYSRVYGLRRQLENKRPELVSPPGTKVLMEWSPDNSEGSPKIEVPLENVGESNANLGKIKVGYAGSWEDEGLIWVSAPSFGRKVVRRTEGITIGVPLPKLKLLRAKNLPAGTEVAGNEKEFRVKKDSHPLTVIYFCVEYTDARNPKSTFSYESWFMWEALANTLSAAPDALVEKFSTELTTV